MRSLNRLMTPRKRSYFFGLSTAIALAALAACVADDPTTSSSGDNDSGADASTTNADGASNADAGTPGFSVKATPSSIVLEPGDNAVLNVSITRTGNLSDSIYLLVTGAGVSGNATIAGNALTTQLTVSAPSNATVGSTGTATITATSSVSNITQTAKLGVRIGHVLVAASTTMNWSVPADVTSATIVAWGAGGGGGGSGSNESGGAGGAGGFEQGDFALTPGDTLQIMVSTGGGGGALEGGGHNYGGGGGGYTAVFDGATADIAHALLVVGGGGGGGSGYTPTSGTGGAGTPGGAGGGTSGIGGGAIGACSPGSTPGGQADSGAPEQGGSGGGGTPTPGGTPGGGAGEDNSEFDLAAGGGGGGYGSGTSGSCFGAGGAGGSGYLAASVANPVSMSGNGATPVLTTDPHYAAPAGVGGTAAVNTAGGPGKSGLVVIYLK